MELWRRELYHYGIKGQHWGIRRGPPYPIGSDGTNRVAGSIKPTNETTQSVKGKLSMALKVGGVAVVAGVGLYGAYKLGSLSKAKELGELAIKKAMLETDLANTVSELESAKKKLAKTESETKAFRQTIDAYKKYRDLELANKEPWKSVLSADDPTRFLINGAKANTIMALWDTMKNSGVYSDTQSRDTLVETMSFMIDQYNSTFDTPVWKLASEQTGIRFNEELHARGPGSVPHSGTVRKVLIPGIVNAATGKAVRKSMVIVE